MVTTLSYNSQGEKNWLATVTTRTRFGLSILIGRCGRQLYLDNNQRHPLHRAEMAEKVFFVFCFVQFTLSRSTYPQSLPFLFVCMSARWIIIICTMYIHSFLLYFIAFASLIGWHKYSIKYASQVSSIISLSLSLNGCKIEPMQSIHWCMYTVNMQSHTILLVTFIAVAS